MSETPQEPIEGVPDDLVDDVDPQMFVTEYRNAAVMDLRDIQRPQRRDTPRQKTPER